MHRFDYSEILGEIPLDITRMMMDISRMRSMEGIRRKEYRKDYERIEEIAKLASVKYSNEIEGIVSTDERIREIVLRGGTPANHSEVEISGYKDVLNEIHLAHEKIRFDRDTVLRIHRTLHTKGSDIDGFKREDNAIVSVDGNGRRILVFEPVPAYETEDHMEQLFLAYSELSTQGYEPLLYIPCIILDFLCIHPFADGNGRTSRLLTELLLYKEGYDICKYVSMDEHIAYTRGNYYSSLGQSSQGWRENRWTYFPFIRYFLRMLVECYMDLDTRFMIIDGKGLNRTQSVEEILKKSIAPMSKRQICVALGGVSPNTIEKSLKQLMKEGRIERIGETKAARYVIRQSDSR